MNAEISEVFNTYNVNILFTVAALPARVSLGLPMGGAPMQGGFTQSGANNQMLIPGIGGGQPPMINYQQQQQQQHAASVQYQS